MCYINKCYGMNEDTDKPTTEPSTEDFNVGGLPRLSNSVFARQREREAERMARLVRERGWAREELYERGNRDTD